MSAHSNIRAALIVAAIAWTPVVVLANGFTTTAFIQPTDLVAFQGFGAPVAADGNVMAIGSIQTPYVVYVYENNNGAWTLQARLTSPTGNATDQFGSSLAIQGNTLVIGARAAHVAYIYSNASGVWTEQAVLAPIGGSGASFAGSLLDGMSISGNTIAVGAPAEVTDLGNTGSVYIFTNDGSGWSQQARIVPSDPLVAGFGLTVSLQNDTLLIGAPFTQSTTVYQPGAAFLFGRQNGAWSQQVRLDPSDATIVELYGQCVSLDGNTAVVGAQQTNEAFIYVNNNGVWTQQAIVRGNDDSDFGTAVKIIGDTLLVTAYDDVNTNGDFTGDAFVYKRGGSTWTVQPDLYMAPGINGIPGPGDFNQRFGNFATMTKAGSQTIFVIGSQTYSTPARSVGAVYTAILN